MPQDANAYQDIEQNIQLYKKAVDDIVDDADVQNGHLVMKNFLKNYQKDKDQNAENEIVPYSQSKNKQQNKSDNFLNLQKDWDPSIRIEKHDQIQANFWLHHLEQNL